MGNTSTIAKEPTVELLVNVNDSLSKIRERISDPGQQNVIAISCACAKLEGQIEQYLKDLEA